MKKEITTLDDFVKNNNHLLSAMAVLAALFAFVGKYPINWLNSILSFLFIGGIIIILYEINSKMPKEKERSLRLTLFQPVILVGMWTTIIYWLLLYRTFWNTFLWFPLWLVLIFSFHSTIKEFLETIKFIRERIRIRFNLKISANFDLDKKILNSKIYKIIIIFTAFFIAAYFSIPLNMLLNIIKTIP